MLCSGILAIKKDEEPNPLMRKNRSHLLLPALTCSYPTCLVLSNCHLLEVPHSNHNNVYFYIYVTVIADQLKRESAELEKEEDKSLRPKNFSKSVKKPPTDCLNTIFGFTKIMWLMHSETIVTDMITDKDGHEMLSKYLSIMSSIYQTHFKFICLFHSILNAKVNILNPFIFILFL